MKLPRNVHGRALADNLIRDWDYREDCLSASHILLVTENPSHGTVPIHAHKPFKLGTLAAILHTASQQKRVTRGEILLGLKA